MRKCPYKGEEGQKIGLNMHPHTKWMNDPYSYFKRHSKIVNFEIIQYCCHLCFLQLTQNNIQFWVCPVFRQIQISLFNIGNFCVVRLPLLDTHNIFSYFLFLLFKDFSIVFSLFVNCKQTGSFFRLLAYPLQVSSAIECLKVTLSEAVYYLSQRVETETAKKL